MSIAAADLAQGIRVDQDTKKGSVYDVIQLVTQGNPAYSTRVFARVCKQHTELHPKWMKLRINGKGKSTPVADAATLVEIAWHCPGEVAQKFKRNSAEKVCRLLGGNLTLVDEIQRRHAQIAGTAEEEFLLAGNPGDNNNALAVQELPYTLEQLQQMQAAAAAIVASKEGIQQCAVVLHDFPMSKYSQYIELKGEEMQLKKEDMQLKEKGVGLDEQQFSLKQKQDEHELRMSRERAELEDRSAKRRRFDANTDDGITFRSLLAKAAEGSSDVKAFEEKARQLSLGLEVYREFKQHVRGNHRPLQYNTEATDAIAKFIAEHVAASTTTAAAKDLRSYFDAVPRQPVDNGDLYSP